MRLLILSDIHANIAALESICEEADAVVFLGDCMGYGPCPAECIAWLRRHAIHAVCGNHDHAVGFDADAEPAVESDGSFPWRDDVELDASAHGQRFDRRLPEHANAPADRVAQKAPLYDDRTVPADRRPARECIAALSDRKDV